MTVGRRVAPGSGRIAALPSFLAVAELPTPERSDRVTSAAVAPTITAPRPMSRKDTPPLDR
jgi:hypothetical protein